MTTMELTRDTPLLSNISYRRSPLRARMRRAVHRSSVRAAELSKRVLDISVALPLLVALAPLFLLIAALIRMTDGGPVLFWQERVGKWGRTFWMPKLRSMVIDAEARKQALAEQSHHGSAVTFKMRRDPRVTWIGFWLRRLSLDELPQLWNVLRGDLTLVGPRPPVPSEVALYTLSERRRLDVTPGLTCIWQVNGRGDIAFPEQVRMDLDYIRRRTLGLDLKLLVLTVPAVLSGRGAY
jgi:lipopolysaccharide/colanic/teichoic acid biosynthesis glycosyltransferase